MTADGAFEARRRALVRDNAGDDTRRGRFALARRQLDRVLAADPGDAAAIVADGELYRLRSQRAATRKTLLGTGIGNAVEWYDWAIYATFTPFIASQLFSKADPASA